MPAPVRPRHVYVHVPFCARRCAYCDFAIAVRSRVPVDEYVAALGHELDIRLGPPHLAGDPWTVAPLYCGGAPPSRLGGDGLARAVTLLRSRLHLAPGAEVTAEEG